MSKVNIKNRKASHDYFFLRSLTAGIVLLGSEVKQILVGKVSIGESFCYIHNGEIFVKNMNIVATKEAFSHDPLRDKKLLLQRKEIDKLEKELDPGISIIISSIFTSDKGLLKANVVLVKGKKDYDKRESIKENDIKRELKREYNL